MSPRLSLKSRAPFGFVFSRVVYSVCTSSANPSARVYSLSSFIFRHRLREANGARREAGADYLRCGLPALSSRDDSRAGGKFGSESFSRLRSLSLSLSKKKRLAQDAAKTRERERERERAWLLGDRPRGAREGLFARNSVRGSCAGSGQSDAGRGRARRDLLDRRSLV